MVDNNPAPAMQAAMQASTPGTAPVLRIPAVQGLPFLNPVDFSLCYTTSATTGTASIYGGYTWISSAIPHIDKAKILLILEKLRTGAEEFCKDSSYFSPSLDGFSGLLSRQILKTLKTNIGWAGHPNCIRLAYVNTSPANYALPGKYRHIFCLIKAEEKSDEEYIIDLTANLFGEKPITFVRTTEVNLIEKPWWNPTQIYTTEQSLIKRQRKDGWLDHQITLQDAKRKQQPTFQFIAEGYSEIEKGIIKILPFDKDAIKFLKGKARGKDFGTNVAQMILDCDAKELKNLIAIVGKYL